MIHQTRMKLIFRIKNSGHREVDNILYIIIFKSHSCEMIIRQNKFNRLPRKDILAIKNKKIINVVLRKIFSSKAHIVYIICFYVGFDRI